MTNRCGIFIASVYTQCHKGDEEFCGRRSSHLEQFASRPANRNSLPIDVRLTSEGPPVQLIDSASEDHL